MPNQILETIRGKIVEANPLKQGLKHRMGTSTISRQNGRSG